MSSELQGDYLSLLFNLNMVSRHAILFNNFKYVFTNQRPLMNSQYTRSLTEWLLQWHHMGVIASQITLNSIVCSTACSANRKKNIPHIHTTHMTGPLWRESTGDQWIPSQRTSNVETSMALCEGNPVVTSGFPSHRASNVEMSPCDDIIKTDPQ